MSETIYVSRERWFQWAYVWMNKAYTRRMIFPQSDVVNHFQEQILEKLETAGYVAQAIFHVSERTAAFAGSCYQKFGTFRLLMVSVVEKATALANQ